MSTPTQNSSADILIVDDSSINLRLLAHMLTEHGYHARTVLNGAAALAEAARTPPDLILLDIVMPDMDGYEVCQRLKADARTHAIPILFISGLSETEDKIRAFTSGGVDYINKPFQLREVLARVETHLRLQRLQQALDTANRELRARQAVLEQQNAELQQIQYTLEESRNRYQDLYDSAPVGYFTFTLDGQIVEANLTGAALLGVAREKLLASTFQQFIAPEDRERWTRQLAMVAETHEPHSCELTLKLQDGATRHAQLDCIGLTPSEMTGKTLRVRAALSDITARKQAEQRAFELTLEHERIAILNKFIQDASHEFRTPLAVIQANLYLLERLEDPARRRLMLAQTSTHVVGITRLVDLLAAIAEFDSGTPFTIRPTDLNQLVDAAASKVQGAASAKGLTLCLTLAPDLPLIAADGRRLRRALQELLDNAVRFTPAGGTVTVYTARDASSVVAEVHDSGPGIPPEALPHIFERFYRQDVAHTTPGFGLGLPIARVIVERHGGQLEVVSQGGSGSVFRVTLPL